MKDVKADGRHPYTDNAADILDHERPITARTRHDGDAMHSQATAACGADYQCSRALR